ncbi:MULTISPECIES: hypothetical protein [Saccharothrix]|uniref:hypothetical protein n=1 Tax=Saccharothrix TaxID=2071 RepID=UPI0011614F01|nr:hypothetical protein [Saccharothrix sp. CB00851]
MVPGSAMLQYLESLGTGWDGHPELPVSAMGTNWTVMSSFEDLITSYSSGISVAAQHKIQYNSLRCTGDEFGLGHGDFPHKSAGNYCLRARHYPGSWSTWGILNPSSPIARAYLGIHRHSAA